MIARARVKGPTVAETTAQCFHFNGIDGTTGAYLFPAMKPRELIGQIEATDLGGRHYRELRHRHEHDRRTARDKLPIPDVDPRDLAESGWGVLFAEGADPAVREALAKLLRRREDQAGKRFRVLAGVQGYKEGDSKVTFLSRHGLGAGPVDPEGLPYYLLLVGSPEEIPFEFQYQLDVQYAVGRLHFDTLEEYRDYAEAVVAAEEETVPRPPHAAFFSVAKPGDIATEKLTEDLVGPLAERLSAAFPQWRFDTCLGEAATKANLARFLGGGQLPAFLMTGSHGLGFPCGHRLQDAAQGALVCHSLQGTGARTAAPVPAEQYFAAADVAEDACLQGLVVFHFACYSAGVPRFDNFSASPMDERRQIAMRAALARLPQRLLAQGALAVVGHVDRAWTWSFLWPQDDGTDEIEKAQVQTFESALKCVLGGQPIGYALEFFNQRYAELATDLAEERRRRNEGLSDDPARLALLWTAFHDARNFVLLGDPAVRLRTRDTASDPAGGRR